MMMMNSIALVIGQIVIVLFGAFCLLLFAGFIEDIIDTTWSKIREWRRRSQDRQQRRA